jgi:hypothetical protein
MNCQTIQEEILESFEEARPLSIQREIDVHLSSCAQCAAFAAAQNALHVRLSAMPVPEMSAAFRSALRARIRRESPNPYFEMLPEIVHFGSWAVATIACALLLPLDASLIAGAGLAATATSYVLLTAVRSSFEAAEQPDR